MPSFEYYKWIIKVCVILSLISNYGLVYQISLIDIFFLFLFLIKYHYDLLHRKDKSEATRIDYFLVSTEILMNFYSSDIRPIVLKFTDHNTRREFMMCQFISVVNIADGR
jgi:hypothetical protein